MSATTHRIPRNTRRPLDWSIPVPDPKANRGTAKPSKLAEIEDQPLESLQPTGDAEGVAIGSGPSQADLRPVRTRPGRKATRPTKGTQKGTEGTTEGVAETSAAVVSPVPPSDATQEEKRGDSVASDRERELEEVSGGIVLDSDTFDISKHDGILTLANPQSGQHRTFRIETVRNEGSPLHGKRIVSLLIGPDNGDDYKGFGFVQSDGTISIWKRFQDAESGIYHKYASMLRFPQSWAKKGVRYYCEARCRRCGRRLTRPDSITSGYGSTCLEMIGG